ncbi:MAG: retron system putative HNH endonuclease [Planctomycetota bacterium]
MRHILKASEPDELRRWRASGNENWTPTYEDLRPSLKAIVKGALLAEQGFVCCYCERRIAAEIRGLEASHIEHLVPQSVDETRDLDYGNLLCSCSSPPAQHCGERRGAQDLPIHPLQPDCEAAFLFGSDGSISPSSGPRRGKSAATIATLGLDVAPLRDVRRRALGYFLEHVGDLPPAQWISEASRLRSKDAQGRFVPHATSVANIIERAG